MMRNLDKVYSVWEDLEKSFESSPIDSRLKFLECCAGYDKGHTKINYLINRVQEDMDSFSSDDEEKYSFLYNKLLLAQKAFDTSAFDSIDNLESFISSYEGDNMGGGSLLDQIGLARVTPKPPSIIKASLAELYDITGLLGGATVRQGNNVLVTVLEDEHAMLLAPSSISISKFLASPMDANFKSACAAVIQKLQANGGLDLPCVFIGSPYFKVTDSRVSFKIGSLSGYKRRNTVDSIVTDKFSTYAFKRRVSDIEYNIICVSRG